MTTPHYFIPGRTGAWLVDLGHDPALYAPDEWRAPGDPTPLDAGTWGLKHGRLVRAGRGALLVQGPCWLTDLDARTRVWAAERRAACNVSRARSRRALARRYEDELQDAAFTRRRFTEENQ